MIKSNLIRLKEEQKELYSFLEDNFSQTLANIDYAKQKDIDVLNYTIKTYFLACSSIELANKYLL